MTPSHGALVSDDGAVRTMGSLRSSNPSTTHRMCIVDRRLILGSCMVLALSAAIPARAQSQAPVRDVNIEFTSRLITTADGLPQNSVNDMMLGADGALWLGTFGGLSRYDGKHITVLSTGGDGQLATPRIVSVAQAPVGTIWVGSQGNGAGVRDRMALRPVPFGGDAGSRIDDTIHDVVFDRRGNAWFATDRGAVRRAVDGVTRIFRLSEQEPGNHSFRLHEDADGGIWVAHVGGVVRIVDDSVHHLPYPDASPSYPPHVLAGDSEGTILLGTRVRGGELLRWDGDRCTPVLTQFLPKSDRIRALNALPDSSWAIGTDAGRLMIWRPGTLTQVSAEHLGRSAIIQVLPRPTGGFWLATNTDGLIELTSQPVRSLTRDGERLPSAVAVTTDRAGASWATLACNGVVRQDKTGRITSFPLRHGVSSIHEAKDGRYWLGTDNGLF